MERGERLRDVLRWAFLPYTFLVYIPFLGVFTVVMGILAVMVCLVSPRAAFHFGTAWSWVLCRLSFSWVSIRGRHNAKKGQSYVVMSNHQSHFDILAFYGHWGRQFRWVMKQELAKVPGLGWYCVAGGHVMINRTDRDQAIASLQAAKTRLAGGVSVMFFPEGTRSRDGRMRELKKGGFMMARDLELPILPVSISGSRHVLPGRSLKLLPGRIRITIHPPIDAAAYGAGGRDRLMADVHAAIACALTPWERGEEPASASS